MTATTAGQPGSGEYKGGDACSLARAVDVVGQRWSFFILREALLGTSRFSEFRTRLGIAPDILTARLETLVDAGLMQTRQYKEEHQRVRAGYHLTEAGHQMSLTIGALQQWGDRWTPSPTPTSVVFRDRDGEELRAEFTRPDGSVVALNDVTPARVREP